MAKKTGNLKESERLGLREMRRSRVVAKASEARDFLLTF